ncbi:GOLPH3/VPS74 family protein [Micromonospora sp. DT231]|uniref:GOLPH3/VPS74 family protein n=1 Tax=Micromonospora sp. DT231 TaxID=3416526 RepID=UPI003CEFCDB3
MDALTLADELALLAHDDAGTNRLGWPGLDHGLAGALLLDLAVAGRVELVDDRLVVTDPAPVGRPLLDDALARIAGERKLRKPQDWVTRLAKDLPRRVLDGLVAAGVLRRESDRVFWVVPRTRYPSPTGTEPAVETEARQRMWAAIVGDGPVPPRTAALLGLTRAVRLHRTLFGDLPRQRVERRLDEIGAGDWGSAATRRAIEQTQAALLTATTAATAAAIAGATAAGA